MIEFEFGQKVDLRLEVESFKVGDFAKIAVFPRQNYSIKSLNSIASKMLSKKDLIYINSKKINISSSLIRKFW